MIKFLLIFGILGAVWDCKKSLVTEDYMNSKKILFVITSHGTKGKTGKPTGYFLSEVTHPWKVFVDHGYEIDFVSPKGGKSPVDGFDLEDPINKEFHENKIYRNKIENSFKPTDIDTSQYQGIFFAGGHGTMWDLPENTELQDITKKLYESGRIVGAVCHGPSALVNVKLSNGEYLVKDKKVNGFTNEEESAVELTDVVPFLLEDKLKSRGGIYIKGKNWENFAVSDQRLVTGQNPQSATKVAELMIEDLKKLLSTK
ncbi:type 1 glutamine amidotransferase domain-containing protein [Leptospira sp. GIMC2001]|uniref:type 1 glutamine amidotransferase domain-containing protein n=1 Tax=Leptospira sp. GIMC2001 TaxID=1513297 RepID=UPI002349553D|nr:type 1 glutamine amidotransferase domain-containing protein [Leptospira sp. GIMC2001]WCL49617.1 type 1 glutamine amidotransferase domain-containing protein [Leptospira sp. GIMC2001]